VMTGTNRATMLATISHVMARGAYVPKTPANRAADKKGGLATAQPWSRSAPRAI
jgi:hypothetical protein